MMLQGKHHIPVSTVQKIVEETLVLHDMGQEYLMTCLTESLLTAGMTTETALRITTEVLSNDLFRQYHDPDKGLLRTDHTRQKYFEANFQYVKPVEIRLGIDKHGKIATFHYIPIKETIRTLFTDLSVRDQLENPMHCQYWIFLHFTAAWASCANPPSVKGCF